MAGHARSLLALVSVLGLVFGLLTQTRPAHAAEVVVTSLVDSGFSTCPSAQFCTLRAAIDTAAPGDTIRFGVTGVIQLAGQLTLPKDVTILGPGADQVKIDAHHQSRVFEVNSGVEVAMHGLTIKNGTAVEGGGIRNAGTLTLTNSTVTGNTASENGGGIYNKRGTLTLTNSTVIQNTASIFGGGIWSDDFLTLTNVTVTGNSTSAADGGGAGIASIDGRMAVVDSTLTHNQAPSGTGGAIWIGGWLDVDGSSLTDNSAVDGGAIYRSAGSIGTETRVTRTTISSNSATGSGGGIVNLGPLPVSVVASTLSANTANQRGGAIFTTATLTLESSTVSGNSAGLSDGGIHVGGGMVSFSTLSGNIAPSGANISPASGVSLRNSIVVGGSPGPNCFAGSVTSLGNNLTDTTSCFAGGSQGDVVSTTPLLGPLALNAPGTTKTHALLPGSPAIDGVTFNPTDCPGPVATDQRGFPRPQAWFAARCDIGAFELEANAAPTIEPIGPKKTDEDTPIVGLGFSVGDVETAAGSLTVTGRSSNQALVPNANLVLGGSGANRTVSITPAANQSGSADVTLTVSDGARTTSTTFTVTVTAVNDPPVATGDAYTISAGQVLTVSQPQNVLLNDTDPEGASLTAVFVQGPSKGTLTLNPNGTFSYTPAASFAGTDSFTYRASDGEKTSSPATVTITVAPTECVPRPKVVPSPVVGSRKLSVHVESTPLNTGQSNPLRQIVFQSLDNAKVTLNGQLITAGQTYTAPPNLISVDFAVERIAAGQPTTVRFKVVDGCGAWETLVGGGTAAGF